MYDHIRYDPTIDGSSVKVLTSDIELKTRSMSDDRRTSDPLICAPTVEQTKLVEFQQLYKSTVWSNQYSLINGHR